jgi:hypothetical protein
VPSGGGFGALCAVDAGAVGVEAAVSLELRVLPSGVRAMGAVVFRAVGAIRCRVGTVCAVDAGAVGFGAVSVAAVGVAAVGVVAVGQRTVGAIGVGVFKLPSVLKLPSVFECRSYVSNTGD